MAEVPEDYDSGPDESLKLQPKRTKSHEVHNAKSDTAAGVNPELLPEVDQEPREVKTKEDDFEERKPGHTENVPLEPDRTPEEEIPKETNMDLPSQAEPETTQVLKLETSWGAGEDLEVPMGEKHEEPDLQPPEVSVDVPTESPTETDTQLPGETKVPEAASSELSEDTGQQNVPEQLLREGDKERGPGQNTPDFPSEKPRKSVEEEDLPPPKITNSEITEQIQEKSEPPEVTKPEFPDQTLRPSTEEADIRPPEEIPIKSTEQIGTEQPEQVEPKSPDEKPRQSIEEKVLPEPLEELTLGLSETPVDEASLERPEKATPEVPKKTRRISVEEKTPDLLEEIKLELSETPVDEATSEEVKPDVQGETQEKSIEEKIQEPSEEREPTGQKEKPRKSSQKSQSKRTSVESRKEKGPVLQEQTEAEFPKEKLIKSTEDTGQVPPQKTKPEVQEKSQPEPSKLRYPVGKDELIFSEHHKKMSEKETNKAKNEYMIGSPRESVESAGTDDESHERLKEPQADTSEPFPTIPASESRMELRDSASEKKVEFSQGLEKMGLKEPKINKNISLKFEHLKWSPERVAEWISELGFPQYKECFTANFINGQKLIHVNCCNLPQMGITDFEDMKTISRHTRELLGIEEPLFSRSISLPYRDNIGLFLEQKGHSGVKSDSLTFSEFVEASGLQEYGPQIEAMENPEEQCPEENEALLQDNGMGEA
ncbi:sterile alpha motif domain-containing protein 15 [Peromyscus californicus insignis]|uniref:sterile alpha motif domain-containing protein 15 n=1 Tax=Peromyscus californicus insignis TaxID=564181 RepID=UPI0022A67DDF|nr:sterile alpha motif domain-containing protein 15 [Peromyscus californicus insignis]